MGKALYRKYRSKNLAEIVGQPHITETLDRALKNSSFSHAYLFTGPRGVGKTSVARILAHEINNIPYESDEPNHLDIIEIDAASNRRIDEIRELKTNMHIAPSSAKYKVYIIDEVHMLTKEAFNALLKSLEEPPEHVVFILATTEEYKVPETIISRTQRFSFKPIPKTALTDHLKDIAKKEKINITGDAIELIAEHGRGSFRDSISLLDQMKNIGQKIDESDVLNALGLAKQELIDGLTSALKNGSIQQLFELIENARQFGLSPEQLAKQLSDSLRHHLLADDQFLSGSMIIKLLNRLARISAHPQPSLGLEMLLYEFALQNKDENIKTETAKKPALADVKPKEKTEKQTLKGGLDEQSWAEVLDLVKKRHNTLYGLIRMASPKFNGNEVTLSFNFAFHQKRLSEAKNQQLLKSVIRELLNLEVTILSIIDETTNEQFIPKQASKSAENHDLLNVSNIFEGAEVVDS